MHDHEFNFEDFCFNCFTGEGVLVFACGHLLCKECKESFDAEGREYMCNRSECKINDSYIHDLIKKKNENGEILTASPVDVTTRYVDPLEVDLEKINPENIMRAFLCLENPNQDPKMDEFRVYIQEVCSDMYKAMAARVESVRRLSTRAPVEFIKNVSKVLDEEVSKTFDWDNYKLLAGFIPENVKIFNGASILAPNSGRFFKHKIEFAEGNFIPFPAAKVEPLLKTTRKYTPRLYDDFKREITEYHDGEGKYREGIFRLPNDIKPFKIFFDDTPVIIKEDQIKKFSPDQAKAEDNFQPGWVFPVCVKKYPCFFYEQFELECGFKPGFVPLDASPVTPRCKVYRGEDKMYYIVTKKSTFRVHNEKRDCTVFNLENVCAIHDPKVELLYLFHANGKFTVVAGAYKRLSLGDKRFFDGKREFIPEPIENFIEERWMENCIYVDELCPEEAKTIQ